MATYSNVTLSGSTSGRFVAVQSTASPGTTVHTAHTSTGIIDELHLWAHNESTADKTLTMEWGGTSTLDRCTVNVPFQDGPYTVIPGMRLEGGVVTRAYAGSTDVVLIGGYVNRITP
jgi:hypothetical protein